MGAVPEKWFRHEGGDHAMLFGEYPNGLFEHENVVCAAQGITVMKVYFVLPRTNFVMCDFGL
jgi:hypothetical protein